MARARNIKPSLFKNEILGVADPLLTLLFASLWCLADREGRLEDRPLRIKAETFPYRDSLDVNRYLTELQRLEFICRYTEGGIAVIQVLQFKKHQSPHSTEKASELPAYDEKTSIIHGCESLTVKAPLVNSEVTEAKRPDSLLLIPDSLKTTLSGKPDPNHANQSIEVINFLNEAAGRNYKPVDANVRLIAARLKEGATVADCKAVIADRCGKWAGDPKMAEYLRPATLFNATKFAQYQGEIGQSDWKDGML